MKKTIQFFLSWTSIACLTVGISYIPQIIMMQKTSPHGLDLRQKNLTNQQNNDGFSSDSSIEYPTFNQEKKYCFYFRVQSPKQNQECFFVAWSLFITSIDSGINKKEIFSSINNLLKKEVIFLDQFFIDLFINLNFLLWTKLINNKLSSSWYSWCLLGIDFLFLSSKNKITNWWEKYLSFMPHTWAINDIHLNNEHWWWSYLPTIFQFGLKTNQNLDSNIYFNYASIVLSIGTNSILLLSFHLWTKFHLPNNNLQNNNH